MSVGILLVTHNRIGQELLATARDTLGFCPVQTETLEIEPDADPDLLTDQAHSLLAKLDDGDGVLVLTDAYGATPSNVACRLIGLDNVAVIAGVNLPMLLRVFNYPRLSLTELSDKAISGGRDGIMLVDSAWKNP